MQSPEALARTLGKDSAVSALLTAANAAAIESMRADLGDRSLDPASPKLLRYLKMSMGALPQETLRVFFLDPAQRLIADAQLQQRSEEHTSELQSLMRISYAVFCLKKNKSQKTQAHTLTI